MDEPIRLKPMIAFKAKKAQKPSEDDLPAPTARKADGDRVRLTCDIRRSSYRKLRILAASQDKKILETVEDLIESATQGKENP
jgi:hypothetical protein